MHDLERNGDIVDEMILKDVEVYAVIGGRDYITETVDIYGVKIYMRAIKEAGRGLVEGSGAGGIRGVGITGGGHQPLEYFDWLYDRWFERQLEKNELQEDGRKTNCLKILKGFEIDKAYEDDFDDDMANYALSELSRQSNFKDSIIDFSMNTKYWPNWTNLESWVFEIRYTQLDVYVRWELLRKTNHNILNSLDDLVKKSGFEFGVQEKIIMDTVNSGHNFGSLYYKLEYFNTFRNIFTEPFRNMVSMVEKNLAPLIMSQNSIGDSIGANKHQSRHGDIARSLTDIDGMVKRSGFSRKDSDASCLSDDFGDADEAINAFANNFNSNTTGLLLNRNSLFGGQSIIEGDRRGSEDSRSICRSMKKLTLMNGFRKS